MAPCRPFRGLTELPGPVRVPREPAGAQDATAGPRARVMGVASRRMLLRLASAPAVAGMVVLILLVTSAPDAAGTGGALLPDLQQELPASLAVLRGGRSPAEPASRLAFRSAVRNVGRAPLVIDGHRSGTDLATM